MFGNYRVMLSGLVLIIVLLLTTSCSTVREAAYGGFSNAVSDRVEREVEREVSRWLANYTEPMLYQLAFTQAFMVGGYGIGIEDFEEGEGTTWRMESRDGRDSNGFTTERALLKKNDDGSSWWYLNYQPDGEDAIEYEVKVTRSFTPLEMYFKDPQSGEVNHYVFENYEEAHGFDEKDDELEEYGFSTNYMFLEEWDDYRTGSETLRIGNRSYDTTVLFYEGEPGEEDEDMEVRWWVSEDVPGHLVRYEMRERGNDSGYIRGEMTDRRQNYRAKFANL
jgi:hypothetical protein